MKKCCESIRKHATKMINFEKKKMIPLTNEQKESYKTPKSATFAKKVQT